MKIDRQMGIISHLVNQRKTTAKELSELFKVSTRTIMRDIDDLSLAGIPLYVMKGKNGGIFLMEDFQTDKPPLTQSERLSIESGLKSRYQVLEDTSTFNAILKLNATNTYSDFEIDLSLSQGNLEIRTLIFNLLEAIRGRVKIKFSYINSQGLVSQKIVSLTVLSIRTGVGIWMPTILIKRVFLFLKLLELVNLLSPILFQKDILHHFPMMVVHG